MRKNFIWSSLSTPIFEEAVRLWREAQSKDLKGNKNPRSFSSFNKEIYLLGLAEYTKEKKSR